MAETSPTLILHIGSEKTGSKSIQYSMRRSADHLLRRYGILYPKRSALFLRNAHYPVVSPFLDPDELDFVPVGRRLTRESLHDALAALRKPTAGRIVLSAEHLSSRLQPPGIRGLHEALRSALPRHALTVLYHVRTQTSQYCAAMSTHIKTLGVDVKQVAGISSTKNRFLNHFQVATEWAEVFGRDNVIVRDYHATDALSLFHAFLAVDPADGGVKVPPKRNTSLSREQADILLALNMAFGAPDFRNEPLIKLRRHVQGSLIYHLHSALPTATPMTSMLSDSDRAHFRREFGETNDRLQRDFGLDFNLNDYMDEGASVPQSGGATPEDRAVLAVLAAERAFWLDRVRGPLSPADAMKVARGLKMLLLRKHISRLFTDRGRALDMSRELAGRI